MEKAINNYVDSLTFEENSDHHQLLDPSFKKVRIREEMMNSTQGFERDIHIHDAFKFLISDGFKYLKEEVFKALLNEFGALNEFLEQIDLNNEIPENLQKFFNLSNQVVQGIVNTALIKYKEGDYKITLSLFVMLSALNPGNDDFWFRQAIAAQICGNSDLALKAYAKALEINPELIGPRLFSIECKLEKGLIEDAKTDLEEVKKFSESIDFSEALSTYMGDLEKSLQT